MIAWGSNSWHLPQCWHQLVAPLGLKIPFLGQRWFSTAATAGLCGSCRVLRSLLIKKQTKLNTRSCCPQNAGLRSEKESDAHLSSQFSLFVPFSAQSSHIVLPGLLLILSATFSHSLCPTVSRLPAPVSLRSLLLSAPLLLMALCATNIVFLSHGQLLPWPVPPFLPLTRGSGQVRVI